MKQFTFSLQKILNLRQFEQNQAELELGKANAEIARIQNSLKAIAEKKVLVSKQTANTQDVGVYNQTSQYFIFLDQRKESFLEELAQAELIAEQRREVVREAMKKVKALEKLREKKIREWKIQLQKEEDEELEDLIASHFKSMDYDYDYDFEEYQAAEAAV